jgi:hypothetical protein
MHDLDSLGLTEMIRLRERISESLVGRFERMLAVVQVEQASAPDLEPLARAAGRIVASSERSALACFPSVDAAVAALVEMFEHAAAPARPRAAVHWAPVLTDGELVVGDPVALAARVAACGAPGELRLTRPAYVELASRYRLRCRPATPFETKGRLLELVTLHWRRSATLPTRIRVRESKQELLLPDWPVVSVGRAADRDGADLAIVLPDRRELGRISRRHIELRRDLDELYCHALSDHPIEVDGQPVARGQRARVAPGSVVRLGGVATLSFLADEPAGAVADESVLQTLAVGPEKP